MKRTDIPAVFEALGRAFDAEHPPIVDLIQAQTRDPFKVLLATILSARTRDETTAAAAERLFAAVRGFDDLRRIPRAELERRIRPVGFFRTKARHLKALPDAIENEFGGRIPETVEALCRLPGVGRKTANLVVAVAFGHPAICVDVHVHRICNRWGLIRTATPLETERTLRNILPRKYWIRWNTYLVAFGQTRCRPRVPVCENCPLLRWCDRRL